MPLTGYYSIVRYVPDIVRDEGINIGIVLEAGTNGDRAVIFRFTENFQRAAKIAPHLGTYVLEKNVTNAIEQIVSESELLNLNQLIANHSGGKLQFTQPRLTLVEADNLQGRLASYINSLFGKIKRQGK